MLVMFWNLQACFGTMLMMFWHLQACFGTRKITAVVSLTAFLSMRVAAAAPSVEAAASGPAVDVFSRVMRGRTRLISAPAWILARVACPCQDHASC